MDDTFCVTPFPAKLLNSLLSAITAVYPLGSATLLASAKLRVIGVILVEYILNLIGMTMLPWR